MSDSGQPKLNQANSSGVLDTDANLCHTEGNKLFAAGRYLEAIKSYTAGIKINPHCPALFTNRAMCYMKLKKPLDLAIADCDVSIGLDRTWWRAFQRKAEALVELGRYKEAESVVSAALSFNPNQDHFRKQLDHIRSQMYRSTNLQAPFGSSLSNLQELRTKMLDDIENKIKPKQLSSAQKTRLIELNKIAELSKKACAFEMSGHTAQAIVLYEKSANAGCTLAMAALGRIFHNGEGLEKPDIERGIFWLKKCVAHGPSEMARMLFDGHDHCYWCAQGSLGQAFRHGIGVEKDVAKAESLLRSSAEGGDIISMNNLGSLLSSEEYLKVDEGALWFLRAANSGYSLAMVNIAICMMRGRGMRQDIPGARAWLIKAEAAGEPHASSLLAEMILDSGADHGDLVAKLETALAAERRINQVQVKTLENLSTSLFESQEQDDDALSNTQVEGKLVELLGAQAEDPSISQPTTNFESGADRFQKYAERLLLLKQIRPTTAQEARAVELLREAIRAGSAEASLRLGQFHLFKRQEADALEVYKQLSRAKNHGEASFRAGMILMRLGGPLQDVPKGLKLLVKASEQGYAEATRMISSLKEGGEFGARLAGSFVGGSDAHDSDSGGQEGGGVESGLGDKTTAACGSEQPSPRDAIVQELQRASLLGRGEPCMISDHMRVPGLDDQIEIMEQYVAERPGSYTGRVVLHALRHFLHFHWLWNPEDPDPALEQLFLAFALDEKAVSVEFRRDGAGAIVATEKFLLAHRAVERRFQTDEADVQAALIHAMLKVVQGADMRHSTCLAGLNRAIAIGLSAPGASHVRILLPRLFYLRGATRCFRGEPDVGIGDFQRCRDLLRGGGTASLAPYALDGLPSKLQDRLRVIELRIAELAIGRATLLLDQPSQAQTRAAADSIRAYIDHVPSDTHYFVNAHYELICALTPDIYKEAGAVQALIGRADAAMGDHIPIFSSVSEASFPKMAQVKASLRAWELAQTLRGQPENSQGRGGGGRGSGIASARAAVSGGGKDSDERTRGTGRNRKGGPVPSAEGSSGEECHAVRASGCWYCGSRDAAGGLKGCKGCVTARYCCRACQVEDWPSHKPVCARISAAAVAGASAGGAQ